MTAGNRRNEIKMDNTNLKDVRKMSAERVCGVADALQAGDEVYVGRRSRPLEVQTRETSKKYTPWGMNKGTDYPYRMVWLVGNGTRYRIRYSHLCEYYPRVLTSSEMRRDESHFGNGEMLPNDSAKFERVRKLVPVSIETYEQLTDWVLGRNIEAVSDA